MNDYLELTLVCTVQECVCSREQC